LACWAGLVAGALSLLAYIPCAVKPVVVGNQKRVFVLGRGALAFYWQPEFGSMPGDFKDLDPGAGGPEWWRWLPKWDEPERDAPQARKKNMGVVIVPLWVPGVLGLVCLYWLLPERTAWHTCAKCAYDLKAVPKKDGVRVCPECGTRAGGGAP
jgi:hypothetical protein